MLVYGAVSLTTLLVVAAVALIVSPPSPPALAEFAPQAESVVETDDSPSSRFGNNGTGGCYAGQKCEAMGTPAAAAAPPVEKDEDPTAPRPPVDPARVRRCVGDPPRQTEDPQSPPCINYFVGDNGGATSRGVTRDEIRIAIPQGEGRDRMWEALLPHFNNRYELYGRSLRLVDVGRYPEARAREAREASEREAFALLSNTSQSMDDEVQQREAARHKLVHVAGFASQATSSLLRENAPYLWTYGPAADEVQRELAGFVCSSLGARPASFAGPRLRSSPRRYAILRQRQTYQVDVTALQRALGGCGIEAPVHDIHWRDERDQVAATYISLAKDETTSLLLLADANFVTQWSNDLPKEYQPEWVVSGLAATDHEAQWSRVMPAERRASLFGTMSVSKLLPGPDTPAAWAYLNEGQEIPTTTDLLTDPQFHQTYRALLLLASGIQMAGPRLTPETFAAGLQRARFPNPGAGADPYFQSHVGFGPGDFTMTHGSAVVWWSDTAPAYSSAGLSAVGSWCYVRRGARFLHEWPNVEDRLFTLREPCR